LPPSRPNPDCLTPPKGAAGSDTRPLFSPIMPNSSFSDKLIRVVPGLRMPDGNSHDQVRVATPMDAISGGADMLVIGRMVTEAENPIEASEELVSGLLG